MTKEKVAGIDNEGLGGAVLQRPALDGLEVLGLAQVDGQGEHLVVALRQPVDRHRGVKTAGVGQHQPRAQRPFLPTRTASGSIASRRCSRTLRLRASGEITSTVSSPATVPRTSGQPASSMATATRLAVPGGVLTTAMNCTPSTEVMKSRRTWPARSPRPPRTAYRLPDGPA